MGPDLMVVYLAELRSECELALQAEKDLLSATKDHRILLVSDDPTDEEKREFEKQQQDFLRAHINVQAMLAHAGAVSRLLRPGGGRWQAEREGRAAELRDAIGVSAEDVDALARGLRNDLEHYDERLYKWSGLATTDLYIHWPSRGLRHGLYPYDNDVRELSRSYHPKRHLYTFWQETYDLAETSAALERVYEGAGKTMFKILRENPTMFAQQDEG